MSGYLGRLAVWAGELGPHTTALLVRPRPEDSSVVFAMVLTPHLEDDTIHDHLPERTPPLSYSPTGRWCYDKPVIRRTRTRTLVTQRYYLDT